MRSRYVEALNSRIITECRHPVREFFGRLGECPEKGCTGAQMPLHFARIQCVYIVRGYDK